MVRGPLHLGKRAAVFERHHLRNSGQYFFHSARIAAARAEPVKRWWRVNQQCRRLRIELGHVGQDLDAAHGIRVGMW